MSNLDIFSKRIQNENPTLVYFYSKKYSSCRIMKTVLKIVMYQLKEYIRLIEVNLDVRTNQEIIQRHLSQNKPAFMLFQKGSMKWKASGVFTSRKLITILKEQLGYL